MPIGSGLAASLGLAPETTYGTYVAPTKFHEFNKVDVKKSKNVVQGGGLAAGRMAQLASRRVVTTEAAAGSIELEVANRGMGVLLQHIFGGAATPVQQAATTAYLQTHTLADNIGKSLTVQEAVPDLTGTLRPHTFRGGKVTSAEFSCEVNGLLMLALDVDFQRLSEVETLAAPSYPAGLAPFHFGQMGFKLGAAGSEAAVTGVKKVSLKIERGMATERYYANTGGASSPGVKAEPVMNDWVKVTGSIDVDYVNKADFADRYHADTQTSLIWEFVGPVIAGAHAQTFRLKTPAVFFDSDTPTVEGPDITSGTFTFSAQLDGTNPLVTCDYMSADSSL